MVAFVGLFFPFHDPWGPCFITSVLHLEPRGGRAAPPSIGRQRVPTGTATSQHARLGGQLGHALVQVGQVGGGQAEVFGVHRGYGSVEVKAVLEWPGQGTGEFLVSKFHRSESKTHERTCQGRKLMKLFLRNPSFGCRYQIGPNPFDWVVGSQQQYMHFVQG